MTVNYTTLLGFALPVTGTESGTWGTTVNDSITELVEDSIAATATASVASGDWTLTTTGSGATNQARCAILIPTGSPGVSRNIIAPGQSKAYVVINQSNAAVVLKGSATTGTTIGAGDRAVVAWNGSDFVTIASSATDGVSTISFGTTGLTPNTATSGAVTVAGTLGVANGGTGNTTIAARSVFVANTADTLTTVTPTAGQSIRVNAGNTAWEAYTPSSGTGDVVGPASATDNAVARFDLTTGKLIQNSVVTIADTTGDIAGAGSITSTSASGILTRAAATQDGVEIIGRAGGTSSYKVTLTPSTLAASRTLTLPEPGSNETLGYLNVPQNVQTGSYTLVLTDAGKHIYRDSGGAATWTIPAASSVAYPIGTALTFINFSGTSVSIAITSDTMRLSSAGTTGTRTLAQYGSATAVKVSGLSSSGVWIISGSGLT